MTIEWLAENALAILVTWRSGSMGGHAVADVLFGDVNPSGKLPMSFPRNVGQIPVHYDHKNTGRPIDKASGSLTERYRYLNTPNSPLYPFGFGLSYRTFVVEHLQLYVPTVAADQDVRLAVTVRNAEQRDGQEVVQVHDDWRWKVEAGVFEIYVGGNSDASLKATLTVANTLREPVEHPAASPA
ncbi:hypothetical protein RvY_12083 [Ramazzottius varieornatus]|uniref:beta-glucosidase n=1 Tax=Ramazzottius varieornatus TaxID=947166 RepID=A0A1D1VS24_RAMVA|nr:hypothetical protein RvY_12083 [Ramazzottius varieornatus]